MACLTSQASSVLLVQARPAASSIVVPNLKNFSTSFLAGKRFWSLAERNDKQDVRTVLGISEHELCSQISCQPRRNFTVKANAKGDQENGAKPTLGFLGLGIMGTAMAHNLVKDGYSVTVWNRTAAKCQPLVQAGALQQATPQAVAASCDITFAMLADPEAAMEVACGDGGATKGLGPGRGYVDVSTVDGATAKAIAAAVRATGATFLEAPVSGSKKPAEDGTLIFLTAGDRELYEWAAPALDVMGKSKFYLGEVGNAAAMKLVVNMVMGSMMASFSEGLALAEKAGLDPTTALEVIGQGAIATPMYALKGPAMIKGTFPPAFPLKHQEKDIRLALALGDDVGQDLPVAGAANEVYIKAKQSGLGDNDFSAVFEIVKS